MCVRVSTLSLAAVMHLTFHAAAFLRTVMMTRQLAKELTGKIAGEDPKAQGAARLVSGVLAGWCSWLSFFPLDAAKTRIQASTDPAVRAQGVLSALKALAREGALYRGFTPVLARALPVHMAYLPVYDYVMARL